MNDIKDQWLILVEANLPTLWGVSFALAFVICAVGVRNGFSQRSMLLLLVFLTGAIGAIIAALPVMFLTVSIFSACYLSLGLFKKSRNEDK